VFTALNLFTLLSNNRSLASERDLQLKQQAWDDFLVTTHWPSNNVTVFPGLGKSATYYASAATDEQQGNSPANAIEPAAAADTGASEQASDAAAAQVQQQQQQELSYWGAGAADGSAQALLASLRTRHRVEDAELRKLAGVEPHQLSEVWKKQPLVDWGGVQAR
jgi:hypothetical protein